MQARHRRVPSARICPYVVSALRTGRGNSHEVTRESAVRKKPEDAERQLHASNSSTCVQTRSGLRRAKHAGSTVSPRHDSASPR